MGGLPLFWHDSKGKELPGQALVVRTFHALSQEYEVLLCLMQTTTRERYQLQTVARSPQYQRIIVAVYTV